MSKVNRKMKPLIFISGAAVLSGCQLMHTHATNIAVNTKLAQATPVGYEWKLIENMSDEFSSSTLDTNKWRDHITTWRGRAPAEFLAKNVSVSDGYLALSSSTHPAPNDEYSMAGAAVSGKNPATYGYFEARIKASQMKMSTTFWLHSDKNQNMDKSCERQFGTEIDILEMIGGWSHRSWTGVMRSNTHYKPRAIKDGRCQGADYISKGSKYDSKQNLTDDFHTYAAWWVNPNQVKYYFDGDLVGTVNLVNEKNPLPFNSDMSLRMVTETYDWQPKFAKDGEQPYPTDEELDNPKINTAYYDYVRSYHLVKSDNNLIKNGDFEKISANTWALTGKNVVFSNKAYHAHTHDSALFVGSDSAASQTVSVQSEQHYLLSGFAKNLTQAKEPLSGAMVHVVDENNNVLARYDIKRNAYKAFELDFYSKKSTNVKIVIRNASETASVVDTLGLVAF